MPMDIDHYLNNREQYPDGPPIAPKDSRHSGPIMALIACGANGSSIVMAHNSPWLEGDIAAVGDYCIDLGLEEPKDTGFWLWTGQGVLVPSGPPGEPGHPEPEYAGTLRKVEPHELHALLTLSVEADAADPAKIAAIEGKYGIITSSKMRFHPNEPVFLFRATDQNAPMAIRHYAWRCEASGCSAEHVAAAKAHAERIIAWQEANPKLVKRPD